MKYVGEPVEYRMSRAAPLLGYGVSPETRGSGVAAAVLDGFPQLNLFFEECWRVLLLISALNLRFGGSLLAFGLVSGSHMSRVSVVISHIVFTIKGKK